MAVSISWEASSDLEVLRASGESDTAFAELFRRFARPVMAVVVARVGGGDDLEDLVQVIFVRAWKAAAQGADVSSVKGWLYQIARNECARWLEERPEATASLEFDEATEPRSWKPGTETTVRQREQRELGRAALAQLPEAERQLLEMRYQAGMTYAEIGEAVGIDRETAAGRIKSALGRLAEVTR